MKNLRVQVLERIIRHQIRGNNDRAQTLFEKYLEMVGSFIVNESEFEGTDDPMFPARREMQRELEDDIEQDRVDLEDFEGDTTDVTHDDMEAGGDEVESVDEVAAMIASLLKAGELDDEQLSQIVDIIAQGSEEDTGEGELDLDGDSLGADEQVPGDDLGTEELPAVPSEDQTHIA